MLDPVGHVPEVVLSAERIVAVFTAETQAARREFVRRQATIARDLLDDALVAAQDGDVDTFARAVWYADGELNRAIIELLRSSLQ